jgi:two-component system NtrC family sensor kinase
MSFVSATTSPNKFRLPTNESSNASSELRFISELARSLLFTVHPKKVATRVLSAIHTATEPKYCGFIAELGNIGVVSCSFDEIGEIDASFISRKKFEKWLELLPAQVGHTQENRADFLLDKADHELEYVSPLHIDGEIRGAIIAGFLERGEFNEAKSCLIDAATRMAAMSVNLSSHYEATIDRSITRAKEEHRRFTESVMDALPLSIYVVDRDYRIVTWNRQREIGSQGIMREDAIGKNVFQVLARYPEEKVREEFERAFRTGKIERIEQQTAGPDGSVKHWVVSKVPMADPDTGEVSHVITIGEDVTMRVEAIHAVGRAEKLAAVGRLAAGVVHEINNPLATISACAEALEHRVEDGAFAESVALDDLNEYLGLIKSEAFRCKSITTGLLDFSRIRTGDRHPLDIAEVINSSARLISHQTRGGQIEIKVEVAPGIPPVHADSGHIQQAVIALATNAIDAMPNGGTLTLRASAQMKRVAIEIEDTGVGIPAEDLSKIFEPFFTTKEIGEGTGLGLAVCYGIVTDHGGRLSVRSNVGKGSIFTIYLPIRNNTSTK